MALRSRGKIVNKMIDNLLSLTPGTKKLKDHALSNLGSIGFWVSKRDMDEVWELAKKKATKNHSDVFILDDRNVLHWNDGNVEILDKKITRANFKKLNALAEKEGCNVNVMVSKLITAYKKKK